MPRFADLPLFPLGVVLLPDEVLPLHVFEPRYRDLVARCLDGDEPFCVVLADDDGIRQIGCLAGGIEVLERYPDGRLDIVVTGGERVAIQDVDEEAHSYLAAEAASIDDDADMPSEGEVDEALAAYRRLVEVAEGEEGPPEPDPGPRLSYAIAGRIEFGPAVKQRLLEERAERVRLADVTRLVRDATRAVEAQRAIAARARTNGRVSPPEADAADD
jgi:Lon protease-like protein